jgi:hypothetical protein
VTRPILSVIIVLACAVSVSAQSSGPAPRPHRVTASAGVSWLGGYPIGSNTATLRRNQPGTTSPSPFTLFDADVSMERAVGIDARLSYALSRAFELEVTSSFAQPGTAVHITQDPETASVVLADQHFSQFVIEGSVVWQLPRLEVGPRGRSYVIAGAGYLRQLDADRVKAETGTVSHVGGGVRYWLRGGDATRRGLGLRAEVRLQMRSGGVELANKARLFPALHLLAFAGL